MASEVHLGVLFQSFECTCLCGCVTKNSGAVGRRGENLMDKLELAVNSQERLAFPYTWSTLSDCHEGQKDTVLDLTRAESVGV